MADKRNTARRVIGGEAGITDLRGAADGPSTDLTKGVSGCWTASGRGALALILKQLRVRGLRHVHLPAFVCESVLRTVRHSGSSYSLYPVELDLSCEPDPPPGSCVLLVDYFGWLDTVAAHLDELLALPVAVIEDASQALLSRWLPPETPLHSVILSPRKLAPTVLGGWASGSSQEVPPPPLELEMLAWRSVAARLAKNAYLRSPRSGIDYCQEELFLSAFAGVEDFLDRHCEPCSLPSVAWTLIAQVRWRDVARRRRENWLCLHELLAGRIEPMFDSLPEDVVPLGYVIKVSERERIRSKLAQKRVFCPVHWPLPPEVSRGRFPAAGLLADRCLTLPVDQRYRADDMCRVVELLEEIL